MILVIRNEAGKPVGQIGLQDGTLVASSEGTRRLVDYALRKANGNPVRAYQALSTFSNGYLDVSEEPDAVAHAVPVHEGTTAMAGIAEQFFEFNRAATIGGQLEFAAINGRHVPGTAYTFRHGWILRGMFNDKIPQWMADKADKEAASAEADGRMHIQAAATVPDAAKRVLTPEQRAMVAAARAAAPPLAPDVPSAPRPPAPNAGVGTIGGLHEALQPQTIAGMHEQLGEDDDPALAALAQPGTSADALKKYVDARIATEVARQVGMITSKQADDTKTALTKMHQQQQKLIAVTRRAVAGDEKADDDLRKHTIMNTLFAIAGVGVAVGGFAVGLGPIAAALAAGLVPLTTTIHDYVRNLG